MKQLVYIIIFFVCPAVGYGDHNALIVKSDKAVWPSAKLGLKQVRVDIQVGSPYRYPRRPVYCNSRPLVPGPQVYYYYPQPIPPTGYYYQAPASVYLEPSHPVYYRPVHPRDNYYHPRVRARVRGR